MSEAREPLRVLVVDDELPARRRLRELLGDCGEQLPVEVVGEAATGREALELVQSQPADVLLLDIQMPGMTGIEVAAHLLKLERPPAVVFVTAYDEYAVKAFEVNAVDYLLKPIRAERLLAALSKAAAVGPLRAQVLERLARGPRRFLSVPERGRIQLVPVADIAYLKAELKYVTVRTAEREYLIEESLTSLEKEFNDTFVRIHRNCLVAREHIASFERAEDDAAEPHWVVQLRGLSERLPVSRRQQHVIREIAR